jgi:hypothetical protein
MVYRGGAQVWIQAFGSPAQITKLYCGQDVVTCIT